MGVTLGPFRAHYSMLLSEAKQQGMELYMHGDFHCHR